MLNASKALIEQVAYSPDGKFFGSVSDDGTVSIYPGDAVGVPKRVAKLDGRGLDLQLTFAPDSAYLAVGGAAMERSPQWAAPGGSNNRVVCRPPPGVIQSIRQACP